MDFFAERELHYLQVVPGKTGAKHVSDACGVVDIAAHHRAAQAP